MFRSARTAQNVTGKTVHALTRCPLSDRCLNPSKVPGWAGITSCLVRGPTEDNDDMISGTDISTLYQEFTDALAEVLAENSVGPARRGRLARARAAVKKHPKYSEHEYFLAVENAFKQWEAIQNAGR